LLSVSEVLNDWKPAVITPVFKKSAVSDVSNYCPISLTCVASKIMERIISRQIFDHLVVNNIPNVYTDFSKAFDSVTHSKLFAKLTACGISGCLLHWIENFLCNRSHQTRVGMSLSVVAELISGIVQGSGIGPFLFLIYINDLINHLEKIGACLKLFADDVKVYAKIVDP